MTQICLFHEGSCYVSIHDNFKQSTKAEWKVKPKHDREISIWENRKRKREGEEAGREREEKEKEKKRKERTGEKEEIEKEKKN